jgi:hypothetical protein
MANFVTVISLGKNAIAAALLMAALIGADAAQIFNRPTTHRWVAATTESK